MHTIRDYILISKKTKESCLHWYLSQALAAALWEAQPLVVFLSISLTPGADPPPLCCIWPQTPALFCPHNSLGAKLFGKRKSTTISQHVVFCRHTTSQSNMAGLKGILVQVDLKRIEGVGSGG